MITYICFKGTDLTEEHENKLDKIEFLLGYDHNAGSKKIMNIDWKSKVITKSEQATNGLKSYTVILVLN